MAKERNINPIDKQVGENLRRIRMARGITQEQLGAQLSDPLTDASIFFYESGQNRLSVGVMVESCRILQCAVGELLAGIDGVMMQMRELPDPTEQVLAQEDIQRAIRQFTRAIIIGLTDKMGNERP